MITPPGLTNNTDNLEGLDLTALIDVIFTLIIFLILTMGTTQIMTEINITHSKKPQLPAVTKQEAIVVEVSHQTLSWKTGGRIVKDFPGFKKHFLSLYTNRTQSPVVLALENTLPVEHLVELMDFLSLNGFANIQVVSEWKP